MGSLGIVPNLGQIYNPDSFTGDGSEVDFTLTHLVTSDQSIIWVEGGVIQKPGIDFTVSGLTLTRTTAPANLVACFAMYLGVSLDIGVPSDGTVTLAKMAVNSVDSDQYVDGSIDAVHLSANSVDSDAYVDGSIDAIHLSANSVDSDAYVDASIDLAHMSSESVDEDNLHISNSGSNGEFLSKQSGDAGGLTWAAAGGGNKTIWLPLLSTDTTTRILSGEFNWVQHADGATDSSGATWTIPDDFTAISEILFFCISAGSGNGAFVFGSEAVVSGEAKSTDTDILGLTTYSLSANAVTEINCTTAGNGLTLAEGHVLGLRFTRAGADGSDTLSSYVYGMGYQITYT